MSSGQIPHIHLLCIAYDFSTAFDEAAEAHDLPSSVQVSIHDCEFSALPSTIQFDTIVSPANSYGILDGGFDHVISKVFSPRDDYLALTRVAQAKLYEEWRGFAPPGTCTLVRIPDEFKDRSDNIWGAKHLALCPTMRVPQDVRWDKEVVYEVVWSLLCALDKHNKAASERNEEKITSILMTPLATGTGYVSAKKWATQTVLAIKHFIEALEQPEEWSSLRWPGVDDTVSEVQQTWNL